MLSTAVIIVAIFGIANSIPVPQDPQLNAIQPQFNPQLLINHLQQQQQGLQPQFNPQLFQQQQLTLPASTSPLAQQQNLFQQAPQQFQPVPPQPGQPQRTRLQPQPQQQILQPQPIPQPQPQQYLQQQITPANPQLQAQLQALQQQQQAQQQSLLGVAYSSAGDVSKTQFNGYGISYNF